MTCLINVLGRVNSRVHGLTSLTPIYFYVFFAWLLGFCHFGFAIKIKMTLNMFMGLVVLGWNLVTSKLNVFTGRVMSTRYDMFI